MTRLGNCLQLKREATGYSHFSPIYEYVTAIHLPIHPSYGEIAEGVIKQA